MRRAGHGRRARRTSSRHRRLLGLRFRLRLRLRLRGRPGGDRCRANRGARSSVRGGRGLRRGHRGSRRRSRSARGSRRRLRLRLRGRLRRPCGHWWIRCGRVGRRRDRCRSRVRRRGLWARRCGSCLRLRRIGRRPRGPQHLARRRWVGVGHGRAACRECRAALHERSEGQSRSKSCGSAPLPQRRRPLGHPSPPFLAQKVRRVTSLVNRDDEAGVAAGVPTATRAPCS